MSNILITAGGTSEPIDSVRSISNTGTGRLGSLIADELESVTSVDKIFYLCSHHAVIPTSKNIHCVKIGSVNELQTSVSKIMTEYQIDAVVHSMAVSDYKVKSISTSKDLAKCLSIKSSGAILDENDISEAFAFSDIRTNNGKLSSQMKSPIILLEQTPKILPLFRKLAPNTVIVGFKLLDKVSRSELIETAHRLLIQNGCNFVLANDFSQIDGDCHTGYLIDSEKNIQTFKTKQEIAYGIAKTIIKEVDAV